MSTETGGAGEPEPEAGPETASELRTAVVAALDERFPSVRGGGGGRTVREVDLETGVVTLSFGCGCSGGVPEQVERAVADHLVDEVPGVGAVRTAGGCGCGGGHRGGRGHGHSHGHGHDHEHEDGETTGSDDGPKAPF